MIAVVDLFGLCTLYFQACAGGDIEGCIWRWDRVPAAGHSHSLTTTSLQWKSCMAWIWTFSDCLLGWITSQNLHTICAGCFSKVGCNENWDRSMSNCVNSLSSGCASACYHIYRHADCFLVLKQSFLWELPSQQHHCELEILGRMSEIRSWREVDILVSAHTRYRAFAIQAGTVFCDRAFQQEVQSGKVQSTSVDKVTCVALAGVVGEYLKYGYAEGGLNDITQIDQLMRALQVGDDSIPHRNTNALI